MNKFDCVDWLCDVWGAIGTKQQLAREQGAIEDWEKMVDILGMTEYCISNSGDFENMTGAYQSFQQDVVSIAQANDLKNTAEIFQEPKEELLKNFERQFISVCVEIKSFIAELPNSGTVGDVSNNWKSS